jgi:hypothetical protein
MPVVTKREDGDEGYFAVRLLATLGREPISEWLADVRFGAHSGLKSDIGSCLKSAKGLNRSRGRTLRLTTRRRLRGVLTNEAISPLPAYDRRHDDLQVRGRTPNSAALARVQLGPEHSRECLTSSSKQFWLR